MTTDNNEISLSKNKRKKEDNRDYLRDEKAFREKKNALGTILSVIGKYFVAFDIPILLEDGSTISSIHFIAYCITMYYNNNNNIMHLMHRVATIPDDRPCQLERS